MPNFADAIHEDPDASDITEPTAWYMCMIPKAPDALTEWIAFVAVPDADGYMAAWIGTDYDDDGKVSAGYRTRGECQDAVAEAIQELNDERTRTLH